MDYEKRLKKIMKNDERMMALLRAVDTLALPDAWICAGLIRNKVWDVLHEMTTAVHDIDVIYFDPDDVSLERENALDESLSSILPEEPWSVKNQARMHTVGHFRPFTSSYDGVAHFPETPTAVAVRPQGEDIEVMAPYGLADLFEMNIKPTPFYEKETERHTVYIERIKAKKWEQHWQQLSVMFE